MTASITIASHSRVYSDRTVAVTGATLTTCHDGSAIVDGDVLYIYYDDIDRLGGAVTFEATATSGNAVFSSDNPARHFVGSITIPSSGLSTAGATSTPPGTSGTAILHIGNGFR